MSPYVPAFWFGVWNLPKVLLFLRKRWNTSSVSLKTYFFMLIVCSLIIIFISFCFQHIMKTILDLIRLTTDVVKIRYIALYLLIRKVLVLFWQVLRMLLQWRDWQKRKNSSKGKLVYFVTNTNRLSHCESKIVHSKFFKLPSTIGNPMGGVKLRISITCVFRSCWNCPSGAATRAISVTSENTSDVNP